MCWSGEASVALATGGFIFAGLAAYKKESYMLWLPLVYFSTMELLQGFTYSVIDQCALPSNQIATLSGYLHISFQPFFINMLAMYFIPAIVRQKIQGWVYGVCFASALFMLLQLYPFEWAGHCINGYFFCSDRLCSSSGNWHIAWEVPVNGITNSIAAHPFWGHIFTGYPTYMIAVFFMPLLYGSWRLTVYHFLIGPSLSMALTTNMNEVAAIWCLLSIGILAVVIKTPIRKFMYVRHWLLWRLILSRSDYPVNNDLKL
jgi:hypothetical protein